MRMEVTYLLKGDVGSGGMLHSLHSKLAARHGLLQQLLGHLRRTLPSA